VSAANRIDDVMSACLRAGMHRQTANRIFGRRRAQHPQLATDEP